MNPIYEKLEKCYQCVREKTDFVPEVAIILGSGFGQFADEFEEVKKISYHEIEGFPVSTVQGHVGEFIFGYMQDVPVVLMNGRVHYYEGYAMSDVVLPTRLMKMLGAKILFLTNAAGGLGDGFAAGDIMMITDQLTMFVDSPLIGENVEELGVRFPDMSEIYDKKLQEILRQTAKEIGLDLKEGIYCQFKGPNYESPAEVRHEHRMRSDRGKSYGNADLRNFLCYQYGGGNVRKSVIPSGSAGERGKSGTIYPSSVT